MKMSILRVSLILLFVAVQAFGQGGINQQSGLLNLNLDFVGAGARAKGMGNAYLGVSDDVTAGGWNPAGLYQHDSPKIGFTYKIINPRGSTDLYPYPQAGILSVTNNRVSHNTSLSNLSSLNFIAPIRIKGHKFVGTFNYTNNYNEYTTEQTIFNIDADLFLANNNELYSSVEGGIISQDYSQELSGGLNSVNFGFGTRVYDKISFGLVLNIYTGTLVNDVLAKDSADNIISGATFGQPALHVSHVRLLDSLEFSGLNVNFGFKYSGEKLSAGLLIRSPLSLKVSANSTIETILFVENIEVENASTVILTPKINPPLTKYNLPVMYGVGFAYQANKKLLLAMDAEYRGYGNTTIKIRDSLIIGASGNNTEFYTEHSPDTIPNFQWKNSIALRFGLEYMMNTKFGEVPLRAGLGYTPVPGALTAGYNTSKPQTIQSASLGTGIHWSQILLDLSYTFSKRDNEINLPGMTSFQSNYYYRNHQINLSFTGYF